jgi:hypothetical protein
MSVTVHSVLARSKYCVSGCAGCEHKLYTTVTLEHHRAVLPVICLRASASTLSSCVLLDPGLVCLGACASAQGSYVVHSPALEARLPRRTRQRTRLLCPSRAPRLVCLGARASAQVHVLHRPALPAWSRLLWRTRQRTRPCPASSRAPGLARASARGLSLGPGLVCNHSSAPFRSRLKASIRRAQE